MSDNFADVQLLGWWRKGSRRRPGSTCKNSSSLSKHMPIIPPRMSFAMEMHFHRWSPTPISTTLALTRSSHAQLQWHMCCESQHWMLERISAINKIVNLRLSTDSFVWRFQDWGSRQYCPGSLFSQSPEAQASAPTLTRPEWANEMFGADFTPSEWALH